jgi:3-oxoacyl-[acyl-carrier protein] reductase
MTLAVVTGASSGIGGATSQALADRGADLILIARSERLEQTRRRIEQQALDSDVLCLRADLARSEERGRIGCTLRDIARERQQPVQALVHAAGVGAPSPGLTAMAGADLEHALSVNVTAPLELTQGLLPVMGDGETAARVLFIGAGVDDKPQPGTGSYGISKLALKRLWRQIPLDLAQEAWPCPPLIGLFQPGIVDTPGLGAHIEAARACGLPHADYLQGVIDRGEAYNPGTVAEAIATLLTHTDHEAFAEREWRTHELATSAPAS